MQNKSFLLMIEFSACPIGTGCVDHCAARTVCCCVRVRLSCAVGAGGEQESLVSADGTSPGVPSGSSVWRLGELSVKLLVRSFHVMFRFVLIETGAVTRQSSPGPLPDLIPQLGALRNPLPCFPGIGAR